MNKLSKVRLASIYYLDTWDTDVETTFSLYAMLLLFILVAYFGKATQGDL